MVKFLDGATSITGLDYQKLLSWYGFHKEHELFKSFPVFKTVIKVFKAFKVFAPCLKNEAVNQLKASFIYWKATRVSPHYRPLHTQLGCLCTL